MKTTKSGCVDCVLPCIGNTCPYYRISVYECDMCGDPAEYHINDEDFCPACAEEIIEEEWGWLTIEEKGELLKLNIRKIE